MLPPKYAEGTMRIRLISIREQAQLPECDARKSVSRISTVVHTHEQRTSLGLTHKNARRPTTCLGLATAAATTALPVATVYLIMTRR